MADAPSSRSPTAHRSPYDWDLLDFPQNESLESQLRGSASSHLGDSAVLVSEHEASDVKLPGELVLQQQQIAPETSPKSPEIPGMPAAGMPAAGMPAGGAARMPVPRRPVLGMPAPGAPASGMPATGTPADGLELFRPGGSSSSGLSYGRGSGRAFRPHDGSLGTNEAIRSARTLAQRNREAVGHPAGVPHPASRLSQSTASGGAASRGDLSWLMPEQSWIHIKEHCFMSEVPLFNRVSSCPENLMEDPSGIGAARLSANGLNESTLSVQAGSAWHKVPSGSIASSLLHGESLPFSPLGQLAISQRAGNPGAEAASTDSALERRIRRALADDADDADAFLVEDGLEDADEFADLEEEDWLGSWPDYSTLGLVPPQVLQVDSGLGPTSNSTDTHGGAGARSGIPSNAKRDAQPGGQAHSAFESGPVMGPLQDSSSRVLVGASQGREMSVVNTAGNGAANGGAVADEWELVEAEAMASLSHFEHQLGTWVQDPAPLGTQTSPSPGSDLAASQRSSQPGSSPASWNHSALLPKGSGALLGASSHSARSSASGRGLARPNGGSAFGSGGWTLSAAFAVRVPLWSSAVVFALLGAGIAFLASWGWEQRGRHLELKQALAGARERCTELADKVRCLEVLLSHVNRAAAVVPAAPVTPVRIVHVPF